MTYTFDPDFISSSLGRLNERQCIVYGVFLLERALPGFFEFQCETGHHGGGELRAALAQCWSALETGVLPGANFASLEACERSMPDSEEYSSKYTSAAIDAVNIACELISYLNSGDISHLVSATQSRVDTIDLFVQGFLVSSDNLEGDVRSHSMMQEELGFIFDDLRLLSESQNKYSVLSFAINRVRLMGYSKLRLTS